MQNLTTGKTPIKTKIQQNATQTVDVQNFVASNINHIIFCWFPEATHTFSHQRPTWFLHDVNVGPRAAQSCFSAAGGRANGAALLSRTHWWWLLSEWRAALSQRSELGAQTSAAWRGGSPLQRLAGCSQFMACLTFVLYQQKKKK